MSLGPQDATALLDHVQIWPPVCMMELQLASADGMEDCVDFLEVFLGLFRNVMDKIMPMSDAMSSESPKTHRHPVKVFGLVPNTQRCLQFLSIL